MAIAISSSVQAAELPPPIFEAGERVLFQGDSITDGNRGRNEDPNHILGHGYAFLIAARYGAAYPDRRLTFLNRGISGDRVVDLAARWRADTIELRPDVLSILIGVNDILRVGLTIPVETYEKTYDQLLADTRAANPQVKLVLCEPFILPHRNIMSNWDDSIATMRRFQAVVERLGAKYQAPVVHFQKMFDEAVRRAPADYWIWDGVHPTYAGHQLMADEWVRTVTAFYRNR